MKGVARPRSTNQLSRQVEIAANNGHNRAPVQLSPTMILSF